jgi:ATP-dependent DNA helicase RecG
MRIPLIGSVRLGAESKRQEEPADAIAIRQRLKPVGGGSAIAQPLGGVNLEAARIETNVAVLRWAWCLCVGRNSGLGRVRDPGISAPRSRMLSTVTIERSKIGSEAVHKVLDTEEGHFVDLKAKEIQPAKLTKAMSAFANADGGELFIGIAEHGPNAPRSWNGFVRIEDANGHLQAFDSVFPLGQYFAYEFLEAPGEQGFVLKATILKTPDIRKALGGVPYVRRGAQSIPYGDPEKLAQLQRAKGITTHERATVAAPTDLITNSTTVLEFMLDVIPTAEPADWLKKQMLIIESNPTVAGIVLFAEEPQAILPKAAVKIYRYKTSDDQGTRETLAGNPETIEGPLYEQIYAAVRRTQEIVQEIPVLGRGGLEAVQYPAETLHEIITNALLHRDYAVQDDVHVRVFDNRVEVESPGRLPAHVTPRNILSERFARNPSLVRLINKFPNPPNKDVCEGLNTAFEAMKALRLREPSIEETGSGVLIKIRHERLASPEEQIMEFLTDHDEITNRQTRELTGIGSENSVKRIFQKMMAADLIERIPDRAQSRAAYRKVGS